MNNSNTNDYTAKKNIRFEHQLIDDIEKIKDPLISFSAWVKEACREKIKKELRKKESISAHIKKSTSAHSKSDNNNHPRNLANKKKARETLDRLTNGIQALSQEDKNKILQSRYPKNELFKKLKESVSKDSIRKYWDVILELISSE